MSISMKFDQDYVYGGESCQDDGQEEQEHVSGDEENIGNDEVNEGSDERGKYDRQEYDNMELTPMEVEVSRNRVVGIEGGGVKVGQVNDNVNVGEV